MLSRDAPCAWRLEKQRSGVCFCKGARRFSQRPLSLIMADAQNVPNFKLVLGTWLGL